MKAWIIGDSFGTPCLTTDIWDEGNKNLPDDNVVQGTEWVKQVATYLGYEYNTLFNLSHPGCSNDYILHNVDWILNNDSFDKEVDMIMIIPTNSSRFMYRSEECGVGKNVFKFVENKTPHLSTAGSHSTGNDIIDQWTALYIDHEFEYYKAISMYDKLLAFLSLYDIDYMFCPGFWIDNQVTTIAGYKPQFIDIEFPTYEIGFQADKAEYNVDVSNVYSNHFTHIGNDAYAKAVIDYINERS
jgi:hypothetical protein